MEQKHLVICLLAPRLSMCSNRRLLSSSQTTPGTQTMNIPTTMTSALSSSTDGNSNGTGLRLPKPGQMMLPTQSMSGSQDLMVTQASAFLLLLHAQVPMLLAPLELPSALTTGSNVIQSPSLQPAQSTKTYQLTLGQAGSDGEGESRSTAEHLKL